MKYLCRVVWSEGMYLGPHHFQTQSRYFEDSIRFAASALSFEPWGLIGCELDGEALRNGTVSLVYARGVFPDGLQFHMPECDPLPAARNISDLFPPTRDAVTVMLVVPARRSGGVNCITQDTENGRTARYSAESRVLADETTGGDEKQVYLGRKNIELLLDTEPPPDPEDTVTLPVARVTRDGSGQFIFDANFVPPCVTIASSERLMSILRRLIEILDEKGAAFARAPAESSQKWTEFATRDIAGFWLLHSINSSLAPMRHLYLSKRGHPEELFAEMLRLGGALCTFALESHPRDLPLYNHNDLDRCFSELDYHIRRHLEAIVPTQFIEIPLVKRADYFYEAEVKDQRCLDRSRWIFGIRSQIGEADVIMRTPSLVKLCSKAFVPQLVKRALPGMVLTHLPVPPSTIPAKVDFQYFSVSKAGPCWDHIVQMREVGLYVPGDLPDPSVELFVVLEQ